MFLKNQFRMIFSFLLIVMIGALVGCATHDTHEESMSYEEAADYAEDVVESTMKKPTGQAAMRAGQAYVKDGMTHVSYAFPTGNPDTSVIMVEKSAPAQVQVGQAFDYTIKLTNLSDCELEDVVVSDRLPKGFQLKNAVPKATVSGDEARWTVGKLERKGFKNIRINGVPMGQGSLTHCAKVTYRTPLCVTVVAVEPKLVLTKSAPAEVLLCDPIPIRYVVTNVGTGVAKNTKIMDQLPSGLTTMDGKRVVEFSAGDLEMGQSRDYTVSTKASKTGNYSSEANASASGGLSAEASSSTMVRKPELMITKEGPKTRFINVQFTYEITVKNNGDAPSKETVLQDNVPMGAEFVSASGAGRYSEDGRVTWDLGTINPKTSRKVSVTLKGQKSGFVRSTATVQGVCAPPVSASMQTELAGIPAILLEVIDLEDPIEVGNDGTYVIMATNQGSAPGTNISVTCVLEPGSEFITAEGPTGYTVSGNTITLKPLSTLDPKAKATWRLKVKARTAGDMRFKVSMQSGEIVRPVEETEATRFYE